MQQSLAQLTTENEQLRNEVKLLKEELRLSIGVSKLHDESM